MKPTDVTNTPHVQSEFLAQNSMQIIFLSFKQTREKYTLSIRAP